jgi:mannobiose 2-epimerase
MMKDLSTFREEVRHELEADILPFWMHRMADDEHGGFYGQIDGNDRLHPEATKGAILNARILWAFSAAYRVLGKQCYLDMATRAKDYLIRYFYDTQYSGIFWELNADGTPHDTKKQIYAIGFAIYGLSEYVRATGDKEALEYAIRLFYAIEAHSFDKEKNGYLEALTREWNEIADMRLSDKDANEKKTMNTHLHILEPYTNLYRVWKDDRLKSQLKNLIDIFLEKILNRQTYHLDLFFDEDWNSKYHIDSYGHDIEASWLMHEAALVLGDEKVLEKVEKVVPLIAEASAEGFLPSGAMMHERNFTTGITDSDSQWWVECESVIGFLNVYQHYGDEKALSRSLNCWNYIKNNLVDRQGGEWYWSRTPGGEINRNDDKAGFWKCPYHNSRMCLEVIERTQCKD